MSAAALAVAAPVIGSVVGGYMQSEAQREANDTNARIAAANQAMQREFAQQGVRWKVADAKAAGVNPLVALGAQTHSYSPVSVGAQPVDGMGRAVSQMGQDISRAMAATSTDGERQLQALQIQSLQTDIQGKQLDNEIRASQLLKMNSPAQIGPSFPTHSGLGGGLISGQGNSSRSAGGPGYVTEKPSERTHSQPGHPSQEAGMINDYGFVRTPTGIAIVPSTDAKSRIEDQMIPELQWAVRNQLVPAFGGHPPPDPRYYPLPKGFSSWKWNPFSQEFQPSNSRPADPRSGSGPGYIGPKLYHQFKQYWKGGN